MHEYSDHIAVTFDTVTGTYSITGLRRMDAEDLAEDLPSEGGWMISRVVRDKLKVELFPQPKPPTPHEIGAPIWNSLTALQKDILSAYIRNQVLIQGIKWLRAEKNLCLRDAKYTVDTVRDLSLQHHR